MPDLLIELMSEEIPARMQARAAEDLKRLMTDGLVEAGLTYASAGAFVTPRRLVLSVDGLSAESPTLREDRRGPRADAPEKAIAGFLRGAGLTRDQVEERETPKGVMLYAVIEQPGRPAAEIVGEVLETTIRNFPWPKSMRWGAGSLRWVRPLHSILCVLSDEAGSHVVPMEVDGIVAGDVTRGHRFMAPEPFSVVNFEDYAAKLKRKNVILDADERAEAIWHDATNLAFASGLKVVEDRGLLAEVAGLVEWPVVLMGEIGEEFLDLPPEVLQTAMKAHQKFFSVRDKSGRIVRFVTVANRETADHGTTILAGNQKVLSARLADAKFFWENDLREAKSGMKGWLQVLENVTFHGRLGSQAERVERIAALARELAPVVGADPDKAAEAARLCKADLSSEMVGEFPELQGLMGRYYIEASGGDAEVAAAAQEHYAPLGPTDAVPTAPVSVAVALADKIDMLTAFWAKGGKPTGSKDPFALRRAALGVIRLVEFNGLSLDFIKVLWSASLLHLKRSSSLANVIYAHPIGDENPLKVHAIASDATILPLEEVDVIDFFHVQEPSEYFDAWENNRPIPSSSRIKVDECYSPAVSVPELIGFIHDRLKVYLRDEGVRHDIIDACISIPEGAPAGATPGNDDLALLVKRARALNDVLKTEDGENLIQGFKRANNILTQAEEQDGVEYSFGADPKWAETDAERALFDALNAAEAEIAPAIKAEDFPTAMASMAGLRQPIDAFFEAVKINADNATVRRNRLNLLSRIRTICLGVADLTRIEG